MNQVSIPEEHRNKMASLFKRLTRLDAFPKLQTELTATTTTGGLLSLVVLSLSAVLFVTELISFRSTLQKYEFLVDHTPATDHSLQVNLDMTVNMPCACASVCLRCECVVHPSRSKIVVRVDVLDLAGESLPVSDQLRAWSVMSLLNISLLVLKQIFKK
jgi:hypothetical protein